MIHTVKGFSIVNEAEVDVFLKLSCFFDEPTDFGNLISVSSAFSKSSLNIWKFSIHVLLNLGWRIWRITLLVCEMGAILWYFEHSLALSSFGIGMKTELFQRGHIRSNWHLTDYKLLPLPLTWEFWSYAKLLPWGSQISVFAYFLEGFPGDTSGKVPACQCRRCKRCGFNPWVGKIPWRRAQQPTPIFLPGESHGQRTLAGYGP